MKLIESEKIVRWVARKLAHASFLLALGGLFSVLPMPSVSSENSLDRIQAGSWVVASMYWEDKLVSTGKAFNPIGWHAAHKTLPIGTLIRVSNPKNHRSINVTINDRGPFVANRDLDLSLGAGTLLGLRGLGTVYMEVLSIPPIRIAGRSWKVCSRSTRPMPLARAFSPASHWREHGFHSLERAALDRCAAKWPPKKGNLKKFPGPLT
jgi:Lytic transglycolase